MTSGVQKKTGTNNASARDEKCCDLAANIGRLKNMGMNYPASTGLNIMLQPLLRFAEAIC